MNVDSTIASLALWAAILAVVVVLAGWHIWYALGLARVFARHDTDPWRAWVPLLNEAEVLRLGRVDPVRAALFLVPVVNLYALALKAIAAQRLNASAGRGGGWTALAVLVPPVWAMLYGHARPVDERPAAEVVEEQPLPGVAFPAPVPLAPAPAASAAPVPPATTAPAGVAPASGAPAASVVPSASAAPGPVAAEVAPASGAPAASVVPSASAGPSASVAPSSAIPLPAPADDAEPAPLTRRARRGADDATAIVRAPEGWSLTLPTGEVVEIAARTLVLGRNPQPAESGVQYVAVSDDGHTVSKQHARLQWTGQGWTVTDLASTNGVTVTDAAGADHALPAEGTAPVAERFALGDAVIVLRSAS